MPRLGRKKRYCLDCNNTNMNTIKVKSIKNIGYKETFDMRAYPTSNFFLDNGVLSHNSGKTTLSFQCARYFDPTFNLSRVVFSVDDFLKVLIEATPGQAVVFDEAIIVNSRSALTDFNKKVIIAMTQIRSKGLYIFFNIPSVFDLDRNLVLNRCHLLLHCYQDSFGDRGKFCVFDHDKMKTLYLKGKRLYSYAFPKANFVAKFTEYFDLVREDYENKKQKEIAAQAKGSKRDMWKGRAEVFAFGLYISLKRLHPDWIREQIMERMAVLVPTLEKVGIYELAKAGKLVVEGRKSSKLNPFLDKTLNKEETFS